MSTSTHGTPYTETEILLELITIYSTWNGETTPDFTAIQSRLRDDFNDNGLIAFDSVVKTLGTFIEFELTQRNTRSKE